MLTLSNALFPECGMIWYQTEFWTTVSDRVPPLVVSHLKTLYLFWCQQQRWQQIWQHEVSHNSSATCASSTSSLFTSISAAFVVFLLRRASFTLFSNVLNPVWHNCGKLIPLVNYKFYICLHLLGLFSKVWAKLMAVDLW